MNFLGTLCTAAGQKLFQRFFGFMKITSGKEKSPGHSGTGLICEMVLVKKLKLEASGHEFRKQYS